MTASGDEPRPGRGDGADMFLGHHSDLIYLALAGVSVAYDVIGEAAEHGPLRWAYLAPSALFLYSLFAGVTVHSNRLCERCVAAAPLDPQAQVERWRPALRVSHARRLWAVAVIVLTAKAVLWRFFPENPLLYAADALLASAIACLVAASWAHRRLYPWCPYCNWGGGGSHEEAPEPEPGPAARK